MTDLLLSKPFVNRMGIRPGTPTIATVILEICERRHLTKAQVLAKYPPNAPMPCGVREARAEIVNATKALGKGMTALARVIGRDHSTIYRSWRADDQRNAARA